MNRELKNGKRYNTNPESEMSENGNVEINRLNNSSENAEEEFSEIHTLTQEAVNEQIKGFIAPLTRQLEELSRLVQGMLTTSYPSYYPRSGVAAHQSDSCVVKVDVCYSFVALFLNTAVLLKLWLYILLKNFPYNWHIHKQTKVTVSSFSVRVKI